ncbi:MAG: serine hydrolase domain-containing protein, partial [Anaerolineales bacterium]
IIGLAAVGGFVLAVLIVWVLIAGPITVSRIIQYGDTDVDDFSQYPGRQLAASQGAYYFSESEAALKLPEETLATFGLEGQLESLLAANDSIAFLVIKDGSLIHESYYQDHAANRLSQLFSVSKSITSLLVGMAIDDGILEGVDFPITDYIPELTPKGYGAVTLKDLLTMTSGTAYRENDNPFGEHVILNYTPDLEAELLQIGMEDEPGQVFRYKSGDNALLALALRRALGDETLTQYTQRRLWSPLGAEHRAIWTLDSEEAGFEKSWCCLATSARDLAKIGQLYLDGGQLAGDRLVSSGWVQASSSPQVPSEIWPVEFSQAGWRNYGYQWWLASEEQGDYFALGKDGQFLYVNPKNQVVIVRLGWSSGELRSGQWIQLFQLTAQNLN